MIPTNVAHNPLACQAISLIDYLSGFLKKWIIKEQKTSECIGIFFEGVVKGRKKNLSVDNSQSYTICE